MKIVEVSWVDAMGESEDFKKGDDHEFCRRVTCGYFVEVTEDGIVLATDYYTSDKHKDELNGKMTIPWGVVEWWRDVR